MEFFPSEIARLVLGYLKEECSEAATMFEAKSLNLIEYRLLALQNKNPRTTVNGMTLINILNQHNSVVSYIQNKLKELTQSQTVSNSGDLIENLETIIKTVGEKNSDQNSDVSVVYENITHRQDSPAKVKKIKLDSSEEQKADITVQTGKIKSEKLTEKQENKLVHVFRHTPRISSAQKINLAEKFGTSVMTIESVLRKMRSELREQTNQLRKQYKLRRSSDDSDDSLYEPRPSTSNAADENDMNCSSSSQREKLRSSEITICNNNN